MFTFYHQATPAVRTANFVTLKNVALSATCLILNSLTATHAADLASSPSLEPLIITASRLPQPASQVLGDVTLISRADLAAYSGQSVTDVLRSVAGLNIVQNGGAGQPSSVFMRGANSNQTLVLIDGVRYSSATTGGAALEHLPVDQIEKIEVLRGSAASLYGADAIGGVIQIFTRRAHTSQAIFSIGGGSQNTQQAGASLSERNGPLALNLTAAYAKTDGLNAITNPLAYGYYADKDGSRMGSLGLNVSYALDSQHKLGAQGFLAQGRTQFDSQLTDPNTYAGIAKNYDYRNETLNGAGALWSDHQLGDVWKLHVQLGQSIDHLKSFAPLSLTDFNAATTQFNTRQTQFNVLNTFELSSAQTLTLGYEHLNQTIDTTTAYTTKQRSINSIFAGYLGHFKVENAQSADLQANIRNDNNTQFGHKTTFLLGAGWHFNDNIHAGILHSTGFKAPTFNDLYYPDYGNLNLKPESSQNTEGFIEYRNRPWQMRLTGFENKISNLITLQPNAKLTNKDARLRGVSLQADWTSTGFSLGGHIDYINAVSLANDRTYKQQLLRRPQRLGLLYAGLNHCEFNIRAEVQAQGSQYDYDIVTYKRVLLPGFALLNIRGTWTLNPALELSVHLNNLLDKQYALTSGYGTLGRNVLVGLTFKQPL